MTELHLCYLGPIQNQEISDDPGISFNASTIPANFCLPKMLEWSAFDIPGNSEDIEVLLELPNLPKISGFWLIPISFAR